MLVAIPVVISALYTNHENLELKLENRSCNSEIIKLKAKSLNFERDQDRLKNGLLQLSVAQDVFPNPKWFKNTDGTMLQLNKAYEALYLIPNGLSREDYIGRSDFDVWPFEVAKSFRYFDSLVIATGQTITNLEPIQIRGAKDSVEVTKYLVKVNGISVGVAGFVNIDYDDIQENIFNRNN